MKKAIIFDLDGVIVDTTPYHFRAWKKTFNDEGITFRMKDYLEKVSGLPRKQGILNIMPNIPFKKLNFLMEKKAKLFLKEIDKYPPKVFDGFFNLVRMARRASFKIACASSSKNAKYLLNKLKILDKFDTIVTGNDFKKPKPHPEIFLLTAKKLKVRPQNCLVFEDAPAGLLAAKNAKMKFVGFASANNKMELAKINPSFIIKSFKEIKIRKILELFN